MFVLGPNPQTLPRIRHFLLHLPRFPLTQLHASFD